MTHWLLALLTLFAPADLQNERASINAMLNEWHRAAWLADEDAYFAHFAGDDAVFMGTDATERWTAREFRAWAHPYFERGKAWEFFAENRFERNISFNDAADTAWFDEQLVTPNMGPCRGTGVLIKQNDQWKIAHYNLSIPLPNAIVDDVVAMAARELLGEEQMYTPRPGDWHAWLDTPGGKLPFRLVFQTQAGKLVPFIVNGGEYIEVPRSEVNRETHEIILAFDHYDSIIRAEIDQLGLRMNGTWTKRAARQLRHHPVPHASARRGSNSSPTSLAQHTSTNAHSPSASPSGSIRSKKQRSSPRARSTPPSSKQPSKPPPATTATSRATCTPTTASNSPYSTAHTPSSSISSAPTTAHSPATSGRATGGTTPSRALRPIRRAPIRGR
ncbi:MAG: nuclear transport factor 2 family protein [Phycisphaerales bacterium]